MDIKDVENLASLARIEIDEGEKKDLLYDMESILDYVKIIEKIQIPAKNVKHSVLNNVWREDKIKPLDFSPDLIVEQFPDKQDGFLKVKKIL